ncbi:serine/threonine-protein kinase haspin [Nematocida minor]|uniref:serine/threonine-protein kinase haspin n=1 Tax=Nematocida minor TaxID=1912983 RepID=UPI00221FC411|nr:serine/threonine-protein kinase haspin [Nematocida minor]KAI5190422.1 serine/threonine-protein kinase haspin [Nematocida minor]
MKIRTFKSKSKPLRRSIGVIAAPELFVLPKIEQQQKIREEKVERETENSSARKYGAPEKKQKTETMMYMVSEDGSILEQYTVDKEESTDDYPLDIKKMKSEMALQWIGINNSTYKENKSILESNEKLETFYEDAQEKKWSSFSCLPVSKLEKLGESTFSEIFMDRETKHVYKIVPLTTEKEYKRVQHTKLDHFIKECLIMKLMNASKYSAELYTWHLINKPYPETLLQESRRWWSKNLEIAENVIPQKNNSSGLFGVIVMEYGGCELEKLQWAQMSRNDVASIGYEIKKCTLDMKRLRVEHRDLHESNILVKKNSNGQYKIKVIDYSLAHAVQADEGSGASVEIVQNSKNSVGYRTGATLYTDIDKEVSWLFEGDDGQPHREVYRKMDKHYRGSDRWRKSGPSNSFWMEYLMKWMENQIRTNI